MKPSLSLLDSAALTPSPAAAPATPPAAPPAPLPERVQRPPAQRQGPLRRPPLGLPPGLGAAWGPGSDSARADTPSTADTAGTASTTDMPDTDPPGPVERGVRTAYTVIDAYLQRGQQAAQQCSAGLPASAPWSGAAAAAATPMGVQAQALAGPWLQLARAWADALGSLAPLAARLGGSLGGSLGGGLGGGLGTGLGEQATAPVHQAWATPPWQPAQATSASQPDPSCQPTQPTQPTQRAPAATSTPSGPRARLTLELMSPRIADVTVSLDPGADLADLHAHWQAGPAAAPGTAPAHALLYCEPGQVHLRLALPDPPQPGRHEAQLIDPDGQAWGHLALTVAAAAPARV